MRTPLNYLVALMLLLPFVLAAFGPPPPPHLLTQLSYHVGVSPNGALIHTRITGTWGWNELTSGCIDAAGTFCPTEAQVCDQDFMESQLEGMRLSSATEQAVLGHVMRPVLAGWTVKITEVSSRSAIDCVEDSQGYADSTTGNGLASTYRAWVTLEVDDS